MLFCCLLVLAALIAIETPASALAGGFCNFRTRALFAAEHLKAMSHPINDSTPKSY